MKHTLLTAFNAACIATASLSGGAAQSRVAINLTPAWRFQPGDPSPGTQARAEQPWSADYDDTTWDIVSLPHSHKLFSASLDAFSEHGRQTGWYRRQLYLPSAWLGKHVFTEFRGAMQATKLWVNGEVAGSYAVSGFDSFSFDIT